MFSLLRQFVPHQTLREEVVFRADAAFATPEIYEALEERGVKYAIQIPANDSLLRDIEELLTHPVGRPSHKPVTWYKGFLYQAACWKTARRVVANVEFHAGGDIPIVTNLVTNSRAVVRFYNKQGKAEQWIATFGEDGRATCEACPVPLVTAGGRASEPMTRAIPIRANNMRDGGCSSVTEARSLE